MLIWLDQLMILGRNLATNEGGVEQIDGDPAVGGAESQVLDLGAGDALNVGQLLQVKRRVLRAVLVDVE